MSDTIKVTGSPTAYKATLYENHRASAVVCALELIHAQSTGGRPASELGTHLEKLSEYADHIEAAVNKKS